MVFRVLTYEVFQISKGRIYTLLEIVLKADRFMKKCEKITLLYIPRMPKASSYVRKSLTISKFFRHHQKQKQALSSNVLKSG